MIEIDLNWLKLIECVGSGKKVTSISEWISAVRWSANVWLVCGVFNAGLFAISSTMARDDLQRYNDLTWSCNHPRGEQKHILWASC